MRQSIVFCFTMLSLLLSGCSGGSKEIERLNEEVAQLKERVNRLEHQLNVSQSEVGQASQVNAEKLEGIVFPDNPTPEALATYIQQVIDSAKGQVSFSVKDPQVSFLTKVGENNIGLLIEAANANATSRYHLTAAIKQLATEKSKQPVLAALAGNVELIEIVVKNGWEKEVKDILIAELEKPKQGDIDRYMPNEWIQAVVGFADPKTYKGLINHFVNGANRYQTYQLIKDLPDIKAEEHILEVWANAKTKNNWERVGAAILAAAKGDKEALDVLVDNHDVASVQAYQLKIKEVIETKVSGGTTFEEKIQWYKQNKDKIKFDDKTGKFITG